MAKQRTGYAGSIANSGVQSVKAPCAAESKKGKKTVKSGKDLRSSEKA